MDNKAVILLSGGMDSCVAAAIALRSYKSYFLHIDYGQRTESKELEVFNKIADYYKIEDRLVIKMDHFSQIGGSALTDEKIEVPKGLSNDGHPLTYVPFRNANLLSPAVSWAEVVGAGKIFIGATAEDSAGYPDCRPGFYEAFNELIRVGTQAKDIEVTAPVIDMKKSEIVKLGVELNVPFNFTWSCYKCEDLACGECDSCKRRIRAFKEAGIIDPVVYMDES